MFSRTVLEQKQWSKTTHLTILTCSGGTGWPWTQKQDRKGEVSKLHKSIRHSVAKIKMPSLHSCFISTGAPNAAGAVGKGMMCPSASNLDVMAAIVAQHYKGLERGNCGSGKHRLRRCHFTWTMKEKCDLEHSFLHAIPKQSTIVFVKCSTVGTCGGINKKRTIGR